MKRRNSLNAKDILRFFEDTEIKLKVNYFGNRYTPRQFERDRQYFISRLDIYGDCLAWDGKVVYSSEDFSLPMITMHATPGVQKAISCRTFSIFLYSGRWTTKNQFVTCKNEMCVNPNHFGQWFDIKKPRDMVPKSDINYILKHYRKPTPQPRGGFYPDNARELADRFGITERSVYDIISTSGNCRPKRTKRPAGRGGNRTQLDELYERDSGICFWCAYVSSLEGRASDPIAREYASRDHLIPRYSKGSDTLDNMVLSCKRHNSNRGHRTVEGYRKFLQEQLGTDYE